MRSRRVLLFPTMLLLACDRGASPPPVPPSPVPAAPPGSSTSVAPPVAATHEEPPAGDAGTSPRANAGPATLRFRGVLLPGAQAPASLDYIAYEPAHARVWVPVGDTGSVDVYDVASATFSRVDGFKKVERERNGKKRMMGPSSVSIGDGVAYVGDRGSGEVCAVDTGTLRLDNCVTLGSPPDGIAYVASTKELWVTTPRDGTLTVLDASKPDALKPKATIKLDGSPEGFAIDEARGVFFTNLEDKDRTVAVDIKTHAVKATWRPDCGSEGPRGIAADRGRGFVYVACTDHVVVLDGTHDGAPLGKLDVGAGIDNIDWLEPRRLLYVGAAKAAKLVVAHVDDAGQLTVAARGESTAGARNGVADASGNAYLADPANARLLVFSYSP